MSQAWQSSTLCQVCTTQLAVCKPCYVHLLKGPLHLSPVLPLRDGCQSHTLLLSAPRMCSPNIRLGIHTSDRRFQKCNRCLHPQVSKLRAVVLRLQRAQGTGRPSTPHSWPHAQPQGPAPRGVQRCLGGSIPPPGRANRPPRPQVESSLQLRPPNRRDTRPEGGRNSREHLTDDLSPEGGWALRLRLGLDSVTPAASSWGLNRPAPAREARLLHPPAPDRRTWASRLRTRPRALETP
ncbi:uncharacterized protein LOC119867079 [Canis lupus familiaris]|uniref:uncharacterized protein LOC119867079 n=1 Tax=Canis lupus familiaris TaxID=9615 RepID=UPI0015F14693|nr:uncharacterized protein LOC119867079 [Canis lupus familiaris]